MPAYIPQTWVDGPGGGTPIDADRLSHMESGIANALTRDSSETVTGAKLFRASAAGVVPVTVQGAVGQTADLFQAQDSAGNVKALIQADGNVRAMTFDTAAAGSVGYLLPSPDSSHGFKAYTRSATTVPFAVVGTTGQTGDLFQAQDGTGNSVVRILPDGTITTPLVQATNVKASSQVRSNYEVVAGDSVLGGGSLGVLSAASWTTGEVVGVFRGASGQTADIFQAQNSAGTVLSRFDQNGSLEVGAAGQSLQIAVNTPFLGNTSLAVSSDGTARTAAIFKGVASQTADIFQVQDSGGTRMVAVQSNGALRALGGMVVDVSSGFGNGDALIVNTDFATSHGVIIYGAAAQTADLFQVKDSAGNVNALFDQYGNLALGAAPWAGATLMSVARNPNMVALFAQGAVGQTSDLQWWRDSAGNVLSKIRSQGDIVAGTGSGGGTQIYGSAGAGSSGTAIFVQPYATGQAGITVKAMTGQTGPAQSWQDPSGNVLSYVAASGAIFAHNLRLDGSDADTNQIYLPADLGMSSDGTVYLKAGLGRAGSVIARQVNQAGSPALIARGAGGQTADIFQAQNSSGTVLSRIMFDGRLQVRPVGDGVDMSTSIDAGAYFAPRINSQTAIAAIGLTGQTGDLFQARNSSGTVLASISADGVINAKGTYAGGEAAISADLRNGSAGANGLYITNNATQTADSLVVGTSTGTALVRVSNQGELFQSYAKVGAAGSAWPNIAMAEVVPNGAAAVGLVVKGASGQTADLFQAQDSTGAVQAKFDSAGRLQSNDITVTAPNSPVNADANLFLASRGGSVTHNSRLWTDWNGGLNFQAAAGSTTVRSSAAGSVGFVAQGAGGQTADILQIQDSTAAVKALFNNVGVLMVRQPGNNDAIYIQNTTDSTVARIRPKAGGGFDVVNNAATTAIFQLTDAGAVTLASSLSATAVNDSGNRVYSAANPPPYGSNSAGSVQGKKSADGEPSCNTDASGNGSVAVSFSFSAVPGCAGAHQGGSANGYITLLNLATSGVTLQLRSGPASSTGRVLSYTATGNA